jgi:hypothetical protein
MTTEKEYPLAKDINGDPVEVPAEAVAWRVRRRSGKQGRPQSVFDPETGTPLEIELDSQIEALKPYGSGGYRLDAIDGTGKLIAGVTAYVEVPAEEVEAAREPESPSEVVVALRELTSLLRESMQTNSRALEAMASAFGPIRPARPLPAEPVHVVEPAAPEQKANDWMTKVMEALPAVAQILPTLTQVFNAAVAQGMANGNPTGGNSTPPTQA